MLDTTDRQRLLDFLYDVSALDETDDLLVNFHHVQWLKKQANELSEIVKNAN